jgi:integrase
MGLTVKQVASLKEAGRYRDQKNLYLQITPSGIKSWLLRYVSPVTGRERWMGLGTAADVDLALAREKAHTARLKLIDGVDPLEVKAAEKAANALEAAKRITFEDACKTYHEANEGRWRNEKSRKQWLSKMQRFAWPLIGRIAVADVDTALILRVLEQPYQGKPLWLALKSAARLRQGIEQVLSWAKVRGYRTGDNPATLELLQHALPARPKDCNVGEHQPSLPFALISEFMSELRRREGVAARALEFAILTAARAGEAIGARWSEIDLEAKTWTVPAARMKGGREHKVPLVEAAIAILERLPREDGNPFVFIGARGDNLGKAGLANVIAGINDRREKAGLTRFVDLKEGGRDAVVHGFRSSFRDWVGEATSFPETLAEAALAHIKGDKVESAYARGTMFEKRRKLMSAWGSYCAAVPVAGNVVAIRSAS